MKPAMRVLFVPESRHLYLIRLTAALRAKGLHVPEAPYPYLRWPRGIVKFARRLRDPPDVVHMHWSVFDSWALARLFFRRNALPKVWTVHNLVPHKPLFQDDLGMAHLYLDHVDVAVWHSQRNLDEARRRFAARGLPTAWRAENRIIPCITFNGAWPDQASEGEARRRRAVEHYPFVVGHFAPTLPYKGTRIFLDAMRRLGRSDVASLIFGECHDPELARDIESAARTNPGLKIHLGPIRNEDLQFWFKACDVIVQPYTDVTTSGSLGFAIAFRRAVIASPLGNIPDVIQDGVTGWLASGPAEVAETIEGALRDPEALRAMGRSAYDAMDRLAGIEPVTEAHLSAYEAARARRGKWAVA